MAMYLLLLGGFLLIFALSFWDSGFELFAPAPLLSIGLIVATTLAMIGLRSWNHVSLQPGTIAALLFGALAFAAGSFLVNRRMGTISLGHSALGYRSPVWKYALLSAVLLVAIALRVFETYKIGAELGIDLSNFGNVSREVRRATATFYSSDSMKLGFGFSLIERQLEKVVTVSGYVCTFLFVRSLVKDKKLSRRVMPGVPLVLAAAFVIVQGGRATILFFAISGITTLFILTIRDGKSGESVSRKFFLFCAALSIICAVAFYYSGILIGRKAGSGIVEYISFYFGCGAPSLQALLDKGYEVATAGVMSFYNLFGFLFKLGFISDYPSYSIAWVDMGGHASNIFTGFARYYLDFGYLGVIVLGALSGAVLTAVYRLARGTGFPFFMVLAGCFSAYTFDMAREEFVFSRLLSVNWAITLVLMVLLTLFLTTSLRQDIAWLRGRFTRGDSSATGNGAAQ